MAIFALRSAKNVNQDNPNNATNGTSKGVPTPGATASRPAASVAEQMIPFDDDMAHFVTHLDADPLAESQLKMHLVEDNHPLGDGDDMIREITDDEDADEDYTFLSFQKLSYAAVTSLLPSSLPPSRAPSPVIPADRPSSSHSTPKISRQCDFTAALLQDNDSDGEIMWLANKARRGKSRAKGLAKKRAVKSA